MRRLVALLILPTAMVVGACSGTGDPVQTEATATTAPTTAAPTTVTPTVPAGPAVPTGADAVSADDLFIAGLRSGAVDYADPETMIILGRGICEELTAGASLIGEVDAVSTGSRGKWNQDAAGAIVGTSIGAYCPQFKNLLPG